MLDMTNHVKLFFDTEFTGLRKNTELISIGIVSEDDRYFYAELDDYDEKRVGIWLKENVIDKLLFKEDTKGKRKEEKPYHFSRSETNPIPSDLFEGYSVYFKGNKKEVRDELCVWLSQFVTDDNIKLEFWSDCLAYDWVLFNDIFGEYSNQAPDYIYYMPFDISTLFRMKGIDPDISREEFIEEYNLDTENKHNSLHDAEVIKACYHKLTKIGTVVGEDEVCKIAIDSDGDNCIAVSEEGLFTKECLVKIFAEEMAKLQRKADKFYYRDNDEDMSSHVLISANEVNSLASKFGICDEMHKEAKKIYDYTNSGKKGYILKNGKIVKKKVFLGGTCNESTWRDKLIPHLQIDYFNPVVEDWNEECYKEELRQREECDYCLYVITPLMTGSYSIAEVVDDSNKRPKKTIFCLLETDYLTTCENPMTVAVSSFSEGQLLSLDRVGKMVKNNGGRYFKSLEDVAQFLNND